MKASEPPSLVEASQHGSATFLGFITAGFVPLLAYLIPGITGDRFLLAVALALLTLFVVGASRAFFSEARWLRAGLEMLLIGALAAAVTYWHRRTRSPAGRQLRDNSLTRQHVDNL